MEGGRDGGMEMVKEGLERCVCWGTGILLGDCVCVLGGRIPLGSCRPGPQIQHGTFLLLTRPGCQGPSSEL